LIATKDMLISGTGHSPRLRGTAALQVSVSRKPVDKSDPQIYKRKETHQTFKLRPTIDV
jgi:hypothetical protein